MSKSINMYVFSDFRVHQSSLGSMAWDDFPATIATSP